ncbi:type II CAAX endopeptidase family protein [Sphingomonas sp. CARO-RG-8B-R24-01]|uniref:CPBP family intramembrane glutamic endopeptidase n=1 Tax=Sphingomonas sp. CARO-RG-8B-R24-01 TaxID=2914831 RepID=UPI001F57FF0E|nr:type II CAAX endopeptidase family protein [Sphingomonas sp. CARO-RG-8B-R24-01]
MLPTEPNTPPHSRVWRFLHFPLILLFVGFVFVFGGQVVASMFAKQWPPLKGSPISVLQAVAFAALIAGSYVAFVRLIERRPVYEFAAAGWVRELVAGLAGGTLLFSLVIGIIAALGGYRMVGTGAVSSLYAAAALAILSGVVEEIVLRGLFFRLLERLLGSWIALALSAALFGALHLGNPNATMSAAVAIALEAGVMLAALYMLTRRLWAAIGMHAAWNFAQGGIYGIAVSGFRQTGLLRPAIQGPNWLTGGSFGAEASVPAVMVNLVFGVMLLVLAHRRGLFVDPVWVRRRSDA